MQALDAIKKAEDSKEVHEFKKELPNAYLTSAFVLFEKDKLEEWNISYYDEKKDEMTSFAIKEDSIEKLPASEVFKKEKTVPKLNLEDVKISSIQALDSAKEFQQKEHPQDSPSKIILILQHTEVGTAYNFTFITMKFNTLNIKVNANTGEIIEHKISSIFDFRDNSQK